MLSVTALHAIKAAASLSGLPEGEFAGAGAIADSTGAPPNYLSKLLKGLAEQGVLVSRKGAGGGFRLARAAELISLYEIVEPIDRVSRWEGCFLGQKACSDPHECSIHRRWQPVRDQYLGLLHDATVAEVAAGRVEV
ncbi:RrF2 family transcriptional regulator [Spirochaeta dissipatitropha]